MTTPIIYRRNRKFYIDEKQLPESSRTIEVMDGLYTALFLEFRGAQEIDKYSSLTYAQRMVEVNNFANKWLKDRKYI